LISGGAPAKRAEVKARAGREFISPLFLPAPPERQNLASGFSSKKVRILSKRYRKLGRVLLLVRLKEVASKKNV